MQAFYFFNTNNVKYLFPDAFIDNISANSEQKCAENYNKWRNIFFLKLRSAFW